jgi:hypothetical protein
MNKDIENYQIFVENSLSEIALSEMDYFIIKVLVGVFVTFIGFLVILIIYKIAIDRKIIYKLSYYFS